MATKTMTLGDSSTTVNLTANGNVVGANIKSKGSASRPVYFDANGVAQQADAFAAISHTHNSGELSLRSYMNGTGDVAVRPLINDNRANRLAFLPADQIIIEKTTDGGTTWVDAGISDDVKLGLFSQVRPTVNIPRNAAGVKDRNCGLRITFTAMKYNVPAGTAETDKYNYWNSTYVKSTERYCQLYGFYFWVNSVNDKIGIKIQRANGNSSTTWSTVFDSDASNWMGMSGWSGNNWVSISQNTFGGSTDQTSQFWNYRITLFSRPGNTDGSFVSGTYASSSQSISEIRGYGDTWWTSANSMMSRDHLYSWDQNQNATFPAKVTAGSFAGNLDWSYITNKPTIPSGGGSADWAVNNSSAAGYVQNRTHWKESKTTTFTISSFKTKYTSDTYAGFTEA